MTPILTFLVAVQAAGAAPPPTQACFEIFADSEGEMARAQDPAWRRKAVGEIGRMRAEHDRRRASIDRAIAKNAKARDRLQRRFDRAEIAEEDFNAARSELETDTRRLIDERDTRQIPACGF
jgi:hypothetical protein